MELEVSQLGMAKLIFRILILFILFIGVSQFAAALEILVIPQKHHVESIQFSQSDLDLIAQSQFDVLQTIKRKSNAVFFVEGIKGDKLRTELNPKFLSEAQVLFPNNLIPNNFSALTKHQRLFLVKEHAPIVALALGYVSKLKATISEQKGQEIDKKIEGYMRGAGQLLGFGGLMRLSPEFKELVTTEREKDAVELITAFTESEQFEGHEIFLLFGERHDFSKFNNENFNFVIYSPCSLFLIKEFKPNFIDLMRSTKNVE